MTEQSEESTKATQTNKKSRRRARKARRRSAKEGDSGKATPKPPLPCSTFKDALPLGEAINALCVWGEGASIDALTADRQVAE